MARYGIEENLSGTVSPVLFDKEFFNFNMMYNGGIFIVMARDPRATEIFFLYSFTNEEVG